MKNDIACLSFSQTPAGFEVRVTPLAHPQG